MFLDFDLSFSTVLLGELPNNVERKMMGSLSVRNIHYQFVNYDDIFIDRIRW